MRQYKHLSRILIVAFVTALGALAPAVAATTKTQPTTTDNFQEVAQSYGTTTALQQGLIVQLDAKNKANVTLATYKDSKKMFGVTVAPAATPISLSSGATGQQVYAVTSGRYNVLVSTQNGTIAVGDLVSISAIDGVGMKADTVESHVLGRAVATFDGKSNVLSSTKLKASDGKTMTASIGNVLVDIGVKSNPKLTNGDSGVPQFVQKFATSLVGKPINAAQMYISAAILLVGIGIVASLIYGGIQTGMTAIGRNPLARKSIMRNMVQVIIAGLMIFIGCLVAVYLILKI